MTIEEVPVPGEYVLRVQGMTCGHCSARVEKASRSVAGVSQAEVDLEAGTIKVHGGRPHEVIAAIKASGYEATPLPDVPEKAKLTGL